MHDDSGEPIGDLYPRPLTQVDDAEHVRHLATSQAPGPAVDYIGIREQIRRILYRRWEK